MALERPTSSKGGYGRAVTIGKEGVGGCGGEAGRGGKQPAAGGGSGKRDYEAGAGVMGDLGGGRRGGWAEH